MKNYKFQHFVDCSHLCFDLFLARFLFSLLTFIKFSIYSRLLHFNPGWNSFNLGWDFSYNCNFIQLGIPSWNFTPGWKSPYNQPFRWLLPSNENLRSTAIRSGSRMPVTLTKELFVAVAYAESHFWKLLSHRVCS